MTANLPATFIVTTMTPTAPTLFSESRAVASGGGWRLKQRKWLGWRQRRWLPLTPPPRNLGVSAAATRRWRAQTRGPRAPRRSCVCIKPCRSRVPWSSAAVHSLAALPPPRPDLPRKRSSRSPWPSKRRMRSPLHLRSLTLMMNLHQPNPSWASGDLQGAQAAPSDVKHGWTKFCLT